MTDATAAYDDEVRDRRRMPAAWLVGGVAALAVVGLATLSTTKAAFSANTGNGTNSFTAGTVQLKDDDAGGIAFNMQTMVPGSTDTKCVNVAYSGVAADVRLYGTVTSSTPSGSLAPYLSTIIEEGTNATKTSAFDCTNFVAGATVHGPSKTLADFASKTNFGNGIPVLASASAGGTQVKSYRITVSLLDDNNAQGKNADVVFTWEAQNR
jgi:hypothetical protein